MSLRISPAKALISAAAGLVLSSVGAAPAFWSIDIPTFPTPPSRDLIRCGDTIEAGTQVTLSTYDPITSGTCTADPALQIEAGASVDLGGFTIECGGSGTFGVMLVGDGASLGNGAISGCQVAIYVGSGSSSASIVDVVVEDVVIDDSDIGIYIEYADNVIVRSSSVTNTDSPFLVNESVGSVFRSCSVNNASVAFDGYQSSMEVIDATVIDSLVAVSFSSDDGSDALHVRNSSFTNCAAGVELYGGTGARIRNNIMDGVETAIYVSNGTDFNIGRNSITNSTYDGIYIRQGSGVVKYNSVSGSGGYDIRAGQGCSSVTYTDNTFSTSNNACVQ